MTGAWIQGVWGKPDRYRRFVCAPIRTPITSSSQDLDPSQRGQIMFAGHCRNLKVWKD